VTERGRCASPVVAETPSWPAACTFVQMCVGDVYSSCMQNMHVKEEIYACEMSLIAAIRASILVWDMMQSMSPVAVLYSLFLLYDCQLQTDSAWCSRSMHVWAIEGMRMPVACMY